jgi:hypothetical protein
MKRIQTDMNPLLSMRIQTVKAKRLPSLLPPVVTKKEKLQAGLVR